MGDIFLIIESKENDPVLVSGDVDSEQAAAAASLDTL